MPGSDAPDRNQEKKVRVFNEAKKLFGRFGFRKTTVNEIAAGAGISKRTVYKMFRSKEIILAELVMFEALSFRRFSLHKLKHLDDPLEKFRTLCDLTGDYFEKNSFLGRVMADDAGLFAPFLGDEIHLVEDGIQEIVTNLLEEGMRKGIFRTMDTTATAQCILALFREFSYYPTDMEAGRSEWVSFCLQAIMNNEQ